MRGLGLMTEWPAEMKTPKEYPRGNESALALLRNVAIGTDTVFRAILTDARSARIRQFVHPNAINTVT